MAKAKYFAVEQSEAVSSSKIRPEILAWVDNPKTGFHSQVILTAHFRLILNLQFLIDKVTIRIRLFLSYDTC